MERIKCCPKCGSINVFIYDEPQIGLFIGCDGCDYVGPYSCSLDEVISEWNNLEEDKNE